MYRYIYIYYCNNVHIYVYILLNITEILIHIDIYIYLVSAKLAGIYLTQRKDRKVGQKFPNRVHTTLKSLHGRIATLMFADARENTQLNVLWR